MMTTLILLLTTLTFFPQVSHQEVQSPEFLSGEAGKTVSISCTGTSGVDDDMSCFIWMIITCSSDSLGQVVLTQSGDQTVQPDQTVTITFCVFMYPMDTDRQNLHKGCRNFVYSREELLALRTKSRAGVMHPIPTELRRSFRACRAGAKLKAKQRENRWSLVFLQW
ncbi:hypothetical protein SRHO_G00008950 [Serrasalmus rhombeus]